MNKEIYDFILKAKEQGQSEADIRQQLKRKGWGDKEITEHLRIFSGGGTTTSAPKQENSASFLEKLEHGHPALIASIAGLVLFAGAFAALATNVWDPGWNPFRPEPREVLTEMVEGADDVQYSTFDLETTISSKDEQGTETFNLTVASTGATDNTDKEKSKSGGTIDVTLGFEGLTLNAEGDFVSAGTSLYVKLRTLPASPLFGAAGTAEQLKGNWIRLMSETEQVESDLSATLVNDLLANENYYNVSELNDERVKGERSYHYRVTLTKEGLQWASEKLSSDDSTEGTFQEFAEQNTEALKRLQEFGFELWVGKSDRRIRKLVIDETLDSEQLDPETEDPGTVAIKLTLVLDYPGSLEGGLSAPDDFLTLEQVFSGAVEPQQQQLQEFESSPESEQSPEESQQESFEGEGMIEIAP